APAATSACMTGTVASSDGSPAVMKGISALRLAARNAWKRWSSLLMPGARGWWRGHGFARMNADPAIPGGATANETGGPSLRSSRGVSIRVHPRHPWRESNLHPLALGDGVDVLVAPAGQVAQHQRIPGQFTGELDGLGDGVAGFERRQDALAAGEREIGRAHV